MLATEPDNVVPAVLRFLHIAQMKQIDENTDEC